MSALIPARVVHVFTHDSIGLGEDGPTHQPVEHLASLRYIPNNEVWRPCDAVESAVPGSARWSGATARPAWCSAGRTWRTSRARASSWPTSRAAATCCTSRAGGTPTSS